MTIVLTDEWHKRKMAAAVPGANWDSIEKAWILGDPTPRAAAVVLKLFPEVGQRHPELVAMRNELLVDVRPFDNATPYGKRIHAPRVQAVLDAKGWTQFDFQSIDAGYVEACLREHGGAYCGWERGLGKTLATCLMIDALDCQRTLIAAPNTAKESVWKAALEEFCPWVETIVLPNDKAKRERTLAACLPLAGGTRPMALVVHYEALAIVCGVHYQRRGKPETYGYLAWPEHMPTRLTPTQRNALDEDERKCYRKVLGDKWNRFGEWDLFASDEAHRLANPKAQMTMAAKKVPAKARLALSGSIIQNHMEELFSPLQWLFPQNYRAQWRDFNDRYLDYVDGGHGKICLGVKPHMVDALRAELGTFMVYRRKEDELPGLAALRMPDQYLKVELSKGQRKVYDQLAATCMAQLEDGSTIAADEGAAMMTKLRQIATGLDAVSNKIADSTKLDLAVELIMDGEDDDWVVFSWYKAPVHALAERLKAKHIDSFVVTGDVPHAKRNECIARFQAGEGRVFIGTLATLGESVNLQRANNVLMLDRSWNPALNVQAEDRVYRQGQKRKTTITHIIAKDTVDELNVLPTLANKEAMRAAILGGI